MGYRTGRDGKFGVATQRGAGLGGAGGGGAGDALARDEDAEAMIGNTGSKRGAFGASATQRANAARAALVDAVNVASAASPGAFIPVPAARLGGVGTLAVGLRDTEGKIRVMLTPPSGRAPPTLATSYGNAPIAHAGDPRLPHRDSTQLRFDANPCSMPTIRSHSLPAKCSRERW